MDIWDSFQKIAFSAVSGLLGYYLGMRAKRPHVVVDYCKDFDHETCIQLNNVGGNSAINVKVEDAILTFNLKPDDPFYKGLNGAKLVFMFDKIDYIEPSKPKITTVRTRFFDEEEDTDSARQLYSRTLEMFKPLTVTYTDSFGVQYKMN